jgi:hypothetical protein
VKAKSTFLRTRVLALVLAGTMVGISTPAQAHDTTRNIVGSGIKVYGRVIITNSHKTITICDDKADNVGVYVEFYVRHIGSDDQYRTLSDTNGSQSGCGVWTASGSDYIILFNGHSRDGWSTGWLTP